MNVASSSGFKLSGEISTTDLRFAVPACAVITRGSLDRWRTTTWTDPSRSQRTV
jgi:hypothetical protein